MFYSKNKLMIKALGNKPETEAADNIHKLCKVSLFCFDTVCHLGACDSTYQVVEDLFLPITRRLLLPSRSTMARKCEL